VDIRTRNEFLNTFPIAVHGHCTEGEYSVAMAEVCGLWVFLFVFFSSVLLRDAEEE